MDLLLGYCSSPSSSPSHYSISSVVSSLASKRPLVTTNHCSAERGQENATLHTCDGNASLLQESFDYRAGDGSDHHCSKGTSHIDGKGYTPPKRGEASGNETHLSVTARAKRAKLVKASIPRVIIAVGDNNKDNDFEYDGNDEFIFERNHPHWEGRWAGHLFLPFPPLESLDNVDQISDNQVSSDEKRPKEDESTHADSSAESDQTEENGALPESRTFLPASRILIHYWAFRLKESFRASTQFDYGVPKNLNNNRSDNEWNDEAEASGNVVIVPHVPMRLGWRKRDEKTISKSSNALCLPQFIEKSSNFNHPLHVSLSRPIYLPAPSVDSFLSSISKRVETVLTASHQNSDSKRHGRVFHLRPHDASIFTNDQQNRSFLTIPISGESAQWVKRVLLPTIDSTMRQFGQGSYYSDEGESCVLHVSVASVKGNMVKRMKEARCGCDNCHETQSNIRSIPLFSSDQDVNDNDQSEMQSALDSIPTSIPIWLDEVKCQFGKAKQVSVKF